MTSMLRFVNVNKTHKPYAQCWIHCIVSRNVSHAISFIHFVCPLSLSLSLLMAHITITVFPNQIYARTQNILRFTGHRFKWEIDPTVRVRAHFFILFALPVIQLKNKPMNKIQVSFRLLAKFIVFILLVAGISERQKRKESNKKARVCNLIRIKGKNTLKLIKKIYYSNTMASHKPYYCAHSINQ